MPFKCLEKRVSREKFHRIQFSTDRVNVWNLSRDCWELSENILFMVAAYEMTELRPSKVFFLPRPHAT
jgi:hypothetical protein